MIMTVSANEIQTATSVADSNTILNSGDIVRVSEFAEDRQGYSSGSLRGKIGRLDFLDGFSGWFVRPVDDPDGRAAYVRYQDLTKITPEQIALDKATELESKVTALSVELDQQRELTADAQSKLSTFQNKLQTTAQELADRNDDDDDRSTLNDLLTEMGLDALQTDYEITVKFTGSYTTSVFASSEDDAIDQIGNDTVVDYLVDGGSSTIKYAIDDVEAELA
jgi:hypothetical protein